MPEPTEFQAERLKHARALELEMIKATVAFEHAALRPPFILNGGALAIYLALYGALRRTEAASAPPAIDPAWAQWAWILWLIGLFAATLATIFGFLSQFAFRRHRGRQVDAISAEILGDPEAAGLRARAECYGTSASRWRIAGGVFVIVSLVAFVAGIVLAFASLR